MNAHDSYDYVPHRPDDCRGIAHWRGAHGGIHVLSLPTCSAWLERQAGDPGGLWNTLGVGYLINDLSAPQESEAEPAVSAQRAFVLEQERDGDWALATAEIWLERALRASTAAHAASPMDACAGQPASPAGTTAPATAPAEAGAPAKQSAVTATRDHTSTAAKLAYIIALS